MKLVYTHPNIAVVTQVLDLIEHAGIACTLRNEYAGGAIGELAPISAWPEVWVVNDDDLDKATAIVQLSQQAASGPDWQCPHCNHTNPATFESCWHCGGIRT